MHEEKNRRDGWTREYDTLRGIRLEYTGDEPAAVTALLCAISPQRDKDNRLRILDVCCGKGRIGLHLAGHGFDVTGFDFALPALDTFRDMALKLGIGERITLLEQDITIRWDLPDHHYDAAIAVTAIENITSDRIMAHFAAELTRVLGDNAVAVIEFFGQNDGYYGILERVREYRGFVVHDPRNGMDFRLYTPEETMRFLAPGFEVLSERVEHFTSTKYGDDYPRETHLLTLRRHVDG